MAGYEYDLTVIGAGTAGLVTAAGAASLGAKVALIEQDKLGGECLYTGCVPSKALIESAKLLARMRRAHELGLHPVEPSFDFPEVMDRMRRVIAEVSKHDRPERFQNLGVTIEQGAARFLSPHEVQVDSRTITTRKAVIATGSRTAIPEIEGLAQTGFIDHVTAFQLTRLPRSLVILGGGPIGLEFAQVFTRFGVRVIVLEVVGQLLPREDPEMGQLLEECLVAEGVEVRNCTKAFRVEKTPTGKRIHGACVISTHGHFKQPCSFDVEEIFIATGRRPNVEGLDLENAGVEANRQGVVVNPQLRTTAKNVWAAGDITGKYLFTHVAEYQGRLVVGNALFPLRRQADYRVTPWTTFTDPEVARVGLTEAEARERHGDIRVYRYSFGDLDRAIIDGEGKGISKVVCTPKGKILGAHVIGPHAGEVIQEFVLAMKTGAKIQTLSQTIHPYPTLSEVARRTADAYYREKLFAGRLPRLLKRVFDFLR